MRSICGALAAKHVPPTTAVKPAHASGIGTPRASPMTEPAFAVSADCSQTSDAEETIPA